ncbi:hypothetical protein [Nocardia alba]|uniref:hypothetical protein n=1 Tax=Nocardia alba TaxID=225051 RepID=UPI00082D840A|nr:hypothetical protein [Nocardia alba]
MTAHRCSAVNGVCDHIDEVVDVIAAGMENPQLRPTLQRVEFGMDNVVLDPQPQRDSVPEGEFPCGGITVDNLLGELVDQLPVQRF